MTRSLHIRDACTRRVLFFQEKEDVLCHAVRRRLGVVGRGWVWLGVVACGCVWMCVGVRGCAWLCVFVRGCECLRVTLPPDSATTTGAGGTARTYARTHTRSHTGTHIYLPTVVHCRQSCQRAAGRALSKKQLKICLEFKILSKRIQNA